MARKKKSISKRTEGRDTKGRFIKGEWKGGPGNPQVRRMAEYRQMLNRALTPEKLRRVVNKLVALAERGDMDAIRTVLERALGKPTVAPTHAAVEIALPELAEASDIVKASSEIIKAITEGRLSTEDGVKFTTLLEMARRSIETNDLAERIAQLEREKDEQQ